MDASQIELQHIIAIIMLFGGLIFAYSRIKNFILEAPLERQQLKNTVEQNTQKINELIEWRKDHNLEDKNAHTEMLTEIKEVKESVNKLELHMTKMDKNFEFLKEKLEKKS